MSRPFGDDIEFSKLLSGDEIELVEVMLELAGDAYPALDRDGCRREIARLRQLARGRVAKAGGTLADGLEAVSDLLYLEEGFHGNREAYYDPRNSYLNEVLTRRCGIPISLGILYMSVAAGAGIVVKGLPAPGHFMLIAENGTQRWFVDPFNQGEVLDEAACRKKLAEMIGPQATLSATWFRAATPLEIVVRVLRNLKAAYAMEEQWDAALPVQIRLVALLPGKPDEKRDLALIHLRNGRPHEAMPLLNEYLEVCDAEAAGMMQPYLRTARRMIAELN